MEISNDKEEIQDLLYKISKSIISLGDYEEPNYLKL